MLPAPRAIMDIAALVERPHCLILDSDAAVSDQYRLFGLPDSFFIDRGGILRSVRLGFLTESQMRERLAQLGLD